MASRKPLIALFGYDSSPFTQKIRMALRLRQIPYTFILVPSMMPRPVLLDNFGLTYRKIPVLAVGRDLYIDTSLIIEAVNSLPAYPPSNANPPLHPDAHTRTLTRILSSHYTDRPLFRLTTGVIPQAVWESPFGKDRANLIGHQLNATKLGEKVPRNLSGLDTYLSILEPLFASLSPGKWILNTPHPSAADISFYYQLDWAEKISRGEGLEDLTGGAAKECSAGTGISHVFNSNRYPNLLQWFDRVTHYFESLPPVETRIEQTDSKALDGFISNLDESSPPSPPTNDPTGNKHDTEMAMEMGMISTPVPSLSDLDAQIGLQVGMTVNIAPDDTGRNTPTTGKLLAWSTQEFVIEPLSNTPVRMKKIRFHFPKVGFVIRPVDLEESKSKL